MTDDEARTRLRERLDEGMDMSSIALGLIKDTVAQMPEEDKAPTLASLFPTDREVLDEKGAEHLVSMTFKSSSGGQPHIVSLLPDGRLTCTCDAMLSIESRPRGCWAMQAMRRVKGIPTP